MCIIAIKPKGQKMFDDDTITTMFINNPDGAGLMYYNAKNENHVAIHKGFMTCKSLLKYVHSMDLTDVNVVMHFRIGTSGLNDALNCHPYPLYVKNKTNMNAKIGMAHNGILHSFNPPKGSKINDTQTFINTVLNKLTPDFLTDDNATTLLQNLIGTNKLAFMDNDGHLTLIGKFIEDKGYYFSNQSYKQSTLYRIPTAYSYAYPRGTSPKNVCTAKNDTEKSVSSSVTETRYKLSEADYDFWKNEPSDFWDDWDRRHPRVR
ncbi:MAG: class II glutamine amidotransferase [Exiguobacterium sp.]|nr:class II glutamine amidotransferase [Exiguobacterium sp.]